MDTEHIAKSSCESAKSLSADKAESTARKLEEFLYKNATDYINKNYPNDNLNTLLICALTVVNDSSVDKECRNFLDVKSQLAKSDISNEILTVMLLCGVDLKYIIGSSDEKDWPRRLDRIMKPSISNDENNNSSIVESNTPFVTWETRNSWSWADIVEPLSVNMNKGNYTITSVPASLSVFAEVVYTYFELSQKCSFSSMDNNDLGLAFPFTQEQLNKICITSPWGQRSTGMHYGWDIFPSGDEASMVGAPIHSIADGTVCHIDNQASGAGHYCMIEHKCAASPTGKIISCYFHMNSKPPVDVGQSVSKGQVIGYMGHTGHCIPSGVQGTHLHFQINENNMSGSDGVDPIKYFPIMRGVKLWSQCGQSIGEQLISK